MDQDPIVFLWAPMELEHPNHQVQQQVLADTETRGARGLDQVELVLLLLVISMRIMQLTMTKMMTIMMVLLKQSFTKSHLKVNHLSVLILTMMVKTVPPWIVTKLYFLLKQTEPCKKLPPTKFKLFCTPPC